MRFVIIILIVLYFTIIIFKSNDGEIATWRNCKEGLFFQMILKKCTLRNNVYDKSLQNDI